ncbi:MAG: S24/S26 family peptidase [Flavobacteriales bacterium]
MSKQTPHFWFDWIRASLDEGKEVEITAKGWSMLPAIKPYTVLTLVKIPIEEIQIGDAIAFARGEHFVVHRVQRIAQENPREIVSRGDANLRFDEIVTDANYCGKVIFPALNPAPKMSRRVVSYLFQLF